MYPILTIAEAYQRLNEATEKFGPIKSAHEGCSVLREEAEEMWDAVKTGDIKQAKEEAIDVIVAALAFIRDCNHIVKTTN
jgi:NTP pyrophosphatase (non-canonical NTP hydrolase)